MTSTQSLITTGSFWQIFPLQFLNIAKHRHNIDPKGLENLQPLEILPQVVFKQFKTWFPSYTIDRLTRG